jgi:hypothetical protein
MTMSSEPEWTDMRLAHAANALRDRIRADFTGTIAADVELRFDPEFSGRPGSGQLEPEHLVVALGEHVFKGGLEHGVETAAAHIAGVLQDDVIDSRGTPWPELETMSGEYVGVLDVTENGQASWRLRGKAFAVVGELRAAVGIAGLRIR